MIVYDRVRFEFSTPHHAPVRFTIRGGTNDFNVCYSSCNEDEYGLANRAFSGVVWDLGAHIGAVAVALAVDNPFATVVAVEPVPDNCDLLWMNARDNGVEDRVHIVKAAAGPPGVTETQLHSGFRGSEMAIHHAFIGQTEVGNAQLADRWRGSTDHDITPARSHDFAALCQIAGPPDFIKTDCEGAEFWFFKAKGVEDVPLIIGEWHNIPLDWEVTGTQEDVIALLPNHDVTFSGPVAGPGGFVAVRRA